jgi:hypothetical protein
MIVILYGGQRAGCCRFNLGRRSRSSTIQRFDVSLARRSLGVGDNDLPLLSPRLFCHSTVMRLLAELVIIAALIFYGWTTPFKDHVAQVNRTITTKLNGLGGKLQKKQDPSVRRY